MFILCKNVCGAPRKFLLLIFDILTLVRYSYCNFVDQVFRSGMLKETRSRARNDAWLLMRQRIRCVD